MIVETSSRPRRFRVLIVEDDPTFVEDLSRFLGTRYDIGVAREKNEVAPRIADLRPDVVLLDIALGSDEDGGYAVLEEIRAKSQAPEVIMLTGRDGMDDIVRAIKSGAYHYVMKPPIFSELVNLVNQAAIRVYDSRRLEALASDNRRLGGDFVVHDASMCKLMRDLDRVGPTGTTVMITGESGTGKELVARRIHELSPRADGPFIPINCAAISEQLIESELFGHVRGAFTGAERDRKGCFARAERGTIFLDEIGYAPLGLQVKLLRALETKEYLPVGGSYPEKADVRIVAASSRDLRVAANEGEFREDLYFRLFVFPVHVPPLRRRPEDILPLANHFLRLYSAQIGRRDLSFSPMAEEFLLQHSWPGNVRELRNMVERAVIVSNAGNISRRTLAVGHSGLPTRLPPYKEGLAEVTRSYKTAYIARVLDECDGNRTRAARLSGLTRESFSRLVKDLSLQEND